MTDQPTESSQNEGADLDDFLARTRPSTKANWLAGLGVTLVGIALMIAFITLLIVTINHGNENSSKNHQLETLTATVEELTSQLETQSDTTACIRLFSIQRDDAVSARDDAFSVIIVTALARGDVQTSTQDYQIKVKAASDAKAAYNDYIIDPKLPCPIKPVK